MARRSKKRSLQVWMNGERVGIWNAAPNEPQTFRYADEWLVADAARPVSLSMPLGPAGTVYSGGVVEHFFDNLLPDNKDIRERLRARFGAASDRAFDLLTEIGRDCIGAIQLSTGDVEPADVRRIVGEPIDENGIAGLLRRTAGGSAFGHGGADDADFRISLAGAQEKTALLRVGQQWLSPKAATPTTHILKLPIGEGLQGIDLSLSVENEWLCSKILKAYGVTTADCWIEAFDGEKTLVVERFDRRLMPDHRWIARIPQEDLCQATGTARDRKYESDGGPGIETIMRLLLGSARAEQDRLDFLRTQILFWMLCAIDGHAKNFSLFLEALGRFRLTPRYDVLSAFPVLGNGRRQLSPHKVKMAMAVPGDRNRHYHWNSILPRHWRGTARRCGVAGQIDALIGGLVETTPQVIAEVEALLPRRFPAAVAEPILVGLRRSAQQLASS